MIQIQEMATCPACWGSGEDEEGRCGVCEGADSVPWPYPVLYNASREVLRSDPQWWAMDSSNFDHPGVTLYSLADWLRRRSEYRPVLRVEGRRRFDGTALVNVKASARNFVMTGLEWGYSGEGPRGLAAVLGDCFPRRFPTEHSAVEFVAALLREPAWTVWP